jgi:hypothetical protein
MSRGDIGVRRGAHRPRAPVADGDGLGGWSALNDLGSGASVVALLAINLLPLDFAVSAHINRPFYLTE